jgi:hypothetical protein
MAAFNTIHSHNTSVGSLIISHNQAMDNQNSHNLSVMKVVQKINIVQSGFTACAGQSQLQANTTLPPPPTKAAIMTWDWKTTVDGP